jgi:uncharacterized repeat protein (TIGR01451 family)
MRHASTRAGALLFCLGMAPLSRAQPYEAGWATVAGGGTSAVGGGVYTLSGSVGAATAGSAVGPPYALVGGFWAAFSSSGDVAIAIALDPAPVPRGARLRATIVVTNDGPAGATGVLVANTGPAGLTFVSNTGDCTTAFPCALGTILAGQSRTIVATWHVPLGYAGPDPIEETVTVTATSADPDSSDNLASAQAGLGAARADLSVLKLGPAQAAPGSDVVYSITVTNAGPSDADGVQLVDPTPGGLIFVSTSGACATPFPCVLGMVPAGESRVVTATFNLPAAYAGPSPVVNAAAVSSTVPDPDPTNDADAASTLVTGPGNLRFFTIAPCRVIDTRSIDAPALAAGTTRTLSITEKCGIPRTATAISGNVTVTGPSAPGHLRLHPGGGALPTVSAVNYSVAQTRANSVLVGLGAAGDLSVFCGQGTGSVHFVLDVNGYFE